MHLASLPILLFDKQFHFTSIYIIIFPRREEKKEANNDARKFTQINIRKLFFSFGLFFNPLKKRNFYFSLKTFGLLLWKFRWTQMVLRIVIFGF